MDSLEKQIVYQKIIQQYKIRHSERFEKKINSVMAELSLQNARSMIIMGCAYLEELCKECILETMTKGGRSDFTKKHNRELTFSFSTTLLFAQDYLSDEIYTLINHLRDIRNKYAHIPIFEENHKKSINDKNKKIRELINGRWFTRDMSRIETISDIDTQLYYIVFENLIFGLMALNMFITPKQKLCRLQFIKGESYLRIHIDVGELNEYSESHFIQKFEQA